MVEIAMLPLPLVATIVDVFSAIIAICIAYYAYRIYKLTALKSIMFLYAGFLLLGTIFTIRGAVALLAFLAPRRIEFILLKNLGLIYTIGISLSYLLIAISYSSEEMEKAVQAVIFFLINPLSEIISCTILLYIIFRMITGSRPSLLIFTGFVLLFLHHFIGLMFLCFRNFSFYLLSRLIQLAAFTIISIQLYRVGREK